MAFKSATVQTVQIREEKSGAINRVTHVDADVFWFERIAFNLDDWRGVAEINYGRASGGNMWRIGESAILEVVGSDFTALLGETALPAEALSAFVLRVALTKAVAVGLIPAGVTLWDWVAEVPPPDEGE